MRKEEIAKRVKDVEERKKQETLKHEKENEELPRRSPRLKPSQVLPMSELNAPAHKKRPELHKDHHKPLETRDKEKAMLLMGSAAAAARK